MGQPKLSLIIPIYNEADLLPEVLRRVRAMPWPNKELVLVDDCSEDGTQEILEQEKGQPNTIVLRHDRNQGKGAAIRTGLQHFTGDIAIIQDADLEYDPAEIPLVIAPIVRGDSDVAYGSRFLGEVKRMRLPNRVANWILARLVTLLYGQRITDEATAYKAFRREVIQSIPLECQRFEFCPEVTAKVLKRGYRIIEIPVTFTARTFEEGKKIGWRDFITAVWVLLKVRFQRETAC
ncbi:MAG TPA: glycosyltransferase family 2 protein [bacterium]|nr:glycosyltransferase family 2 protein [bacterium]HQL63080.1 glycosyltransferase family 2 protein [bacterium]